MIQMLYRRKGSQLEKCELGMIRVIYQRNGSPMENVSRVAISVFFFVNSEIGGKIA